MDMYKFRPDSKQTSLPFNGFIKKSSASPTDFMKILGDLPPSSNVTGIIFSVAYCITKRPVEPVNAAFDTFCLLPTLFQAQHQNH
jgi:hypothetical protein